MADYDLILASPIGGLFDVARGGFVNLATMRVDLSLWGEWERATANCGANSSRLWPSDPHGISDKKLLYCPHPLKGSKFDTMDFRPEYFADRRDMIVISAGYNKTIWNVLEDNCGFHRDGPLVNPQTPANNLRGKSFYDDLEASLRCVDTFVKELGKDQYFQICNEGKWTDGWKVNKGNVAWLAAMYVRLVKYHGVPADHVSFGFEIPFRYDKATKKFKVDSLHDPIGQSWEIIKKSGITRDQFCQSRYAAHNIGGAPETVDGVKFPYGYDSQAAVQIMQDCKEARVAECSDDGIDQNKNWKAGQGRFPRSTPAELAISYGYVLSKIKRGLSIETLTYRDLVEPALDALAGAYKKHRGKELENRGKFPKPEPIIPPIIIIDDEEKPEPLPEVKVKITWQGWLGLGVIFIIILILAITC